MFPISPSFLRHFDTLSADDKARHAEKVFEQASAQAQEDAFPIYVAARVRIEDRDWIGANANEVADKLLIEWHGDGTAEVVSQFVLYILVVEHGRTDIAIQLMAVDPFRAAMGFGPVLPHVSFSEGQFQTLLVQLQERVSGDGAQGLVLDLLRSWAGTHPQQSLDHLVGHADLHTSLALPLAQGVLDADGCRHALLETWEQWVRSEGGHKHLALALIPSLCSHGLIEDADAFSIIGAFVASEHVEVADAALFAVGRIVSERATRDAIALLRRAISDTREKIQWRVSHIILFNEYSDVQDLALPFLESVTDLDVNRASVIRNIDGLLRNLVQKDMKAVETFLRAWIIEHPNEDPHDLPRQTRFVGTLSALAERREAVGGFVTAWMMQEAAVARAGSFLLDHFRIDEFHLGALTRAVDELVVCLVERTLAFYFQPIRKFRLLRSLMPICEPSERKVHVNEAFEELCLNYPGAAERFLEELPADDQVSQELKHEIDKVLSTYFAPDGESEALREFLPPPPRRQDYARHQQKKQAETSEAIRTSGDFPLAELVHTVRIGRGDAWVIASRDGSAPDAPSRFTESVVSLELPRLEILDPDTEAMKRIVRIHRLRREDEAGG